MKTTIISVALLASAFLTDFSEGQAIIHNGTFIEDFTETCAEVIAANDFYGTCCSFSDINDDGKQGCRLTVAGESSACGWNNKKYLEDCNDNGGCVSGPYVTVQYAAVNMTAVAECPPTEYEWNVTTTTSTADDVSSGRLPSSCYSIIGWFGLVLLNVLF